MRSDELAEIPQRLIVCLDGTWNKRGSGTNVYHLSNLIAEGVVGTGAARRRQRIHYDEGVGTSILDGFTGGSFGVGLSENVRQAYDWLVEHYGDGDEIYVFGFSRGAFTARSLVALIAKCGLLERGAPMPADELWRAYQILGRHGNALAGTRPRANLRERLFGRTRPPFRSLWTIRPDDWASGERKEPPANRSERLLLASSRRVRIRCVGIFDTVGSMGLDALAIPWLRDRTARFHDMRLPSIIDHGFQALAIDEHRSNFAHVPWLGRPDPARGGGPAQVVKQRWFVGAHSNVGGGYASDPLARFPLRWMVAECEALGLVFRDGARNALQPLPLGLAMPLLSPMAKAGDLEEALPVVRDSFTEFGAGSWRHFVRSKRSYRRIAPPAEMVDGKPSRSVGEELDPSVDVLRAADRDRPPGERRYDPPNLWAYERDAARPKPAYRHLEGGRSVAALAVWLALIGVASWKANAMLVEWLGGAPERSGHRWWFLLVPVLALAVDWLEGKLRHGLALDPVGARAERDRVVAETLMTLRILAFLAFLAGAAILLETIAGRVADGDPTAATRWLLVLDVLLLLLGAAFTWTGSPMLAAGFGSIELLQRQRTPAGVREAFVEWVGDWTIHAGAAEKKELLLPVVRALWRDLLTLIPIYCVALFFGLWRLLAWIADETPFGAAWSAAWIAGVWVLATAAVDVAEDALHLRFVRILPSAPSRLAAWSAYALGRAKLVLFGGGLLASVASVVLLATDEIVRIVDTGEMGLLRSTAVVLALVALGAMARDFHGRRQDRRRSSGGRTDAKALGGRGERVPA